MPHSPANTNSGDSAVPTTRSVRWRPLTSAVSVEPGARPRFSAKPCDTSTSRLPSPRRAPSSDDSARPLASVTRFSECGRRASMPISWPMMGSATPSICTRTICSTLACTSATPGSAASCAASASGARLTLANRSAKCASA